MIPVFMNSLVQGWKSKNSSELIKKIIPNHGKCHVRNTQGAKSRNNELDMQEQSQEDGEGEAHVGLGP